MVKKFQKLFPADRQQSKEYIDAGKKNLYCPGKKRSTVYEKNCVMPKSSWFGSNREKSISGGLCERERSSTQGISSGERREGQCLG